MRYRLPHGREVPQSSTNLHHLNWPRRDYKHQIDKNYRSNLILQLHVPVHAELHKELYPPPKPSRDFMLNAINTAVEIRRAS